MFLLHRRIGVQFIDVECNEWKINFKTACIHFLYCQPGSDVALKTAIMAAWIIVLETETFAQS